MGGMKAALLDATMSAVRGGDTRLSTLSRPERGPAATASCDVTQLQDLGRVASPPGCCRSKCGYLLKTVAWRAVRKVDPIRNRALCKRRLDALRTEVARGNANEGAPEWASNAGAGPRLLGSLRTEDGKGVVRMEDRFDTGIGDVWSALTDPLRLARWYGEIEGDLRSAVSAHAFLPADGKAPGAWKCATPAATAAYAAGDAGPAERVSRHRGHAGRRRRPDHPDPRGTGHAPGPARRLRGRGRDPCRRSSRLLAGRERCDAAARWHELAGLPMKTWPRTSRRHWLLPD